VRGPRPGSPPGHTCDQESFFPARNDAPLLRSRGLRVRSFSPGGILSGSPLGKPPPVRTTLLLSPSFKSPLPFKCLYFTEQIKASSFFDSVLVRRPFSYSEAAYLFFAGVDDVLFSKILPVLLHALSDLLISIRDVPPRLFSRNFFDFL